MRIHLLSDVHTEFAPFFTRADDFDVVVLAGDIGKGVRGVQWAARTFPKVRVFYVPGNHEYYGGALPRVTEKMRTAAKGTSVTVLERDVVEHEGIRFLGTTLWTDFQLFGQANVSAAREYARHGMNDYSKIRKSPRFSRLRPEDTQQLFAASFTWLKAELARPSPLPTVVITHHAPSLRSVQDRYHKDRLAPAYASALDEFVGQSGAALWMHGHTHRCVDYPLGRTRVVSNQRGYPGEPAEGFDPLFSVTVDP